MKIFLLVLVILGADGKPRLDKHGPYTFAQCMDLAQAASNQGIQAHCVTIPPPESDEKDKKA